MVIIGFPVLDPKTLINSNSVASVFKPARYLHLQLHALKHTCQFSSVLSLGACCFGSWIGCLSSVPSLSSLLEVSYNDARPVSLPQSGPLTLPAPCLPARLNSSPDGLAAGIPPGQSGRAS